MIKAATSSLATCRAKGLLAACWGLVGGQLAGADGVSVFSAVSVSYFGFCSSLVWSMDGVESCMSCGQG